MLIDIWLNISQWADHLLIVDEMHFLFFRCSCAEPYFVSELLYASNDTLTNSRDVDLIVVTYRSAKESNDDIVNIIEKISETGDLMLDIDFDYFSTTNPFKDIYSSKQLDLFATLYRFDVKTTPEESIVERQRQLQYLSATISSIINKRKAGGDCGDNLTDSNEDVR